MWRWFVYAWVCTCVAVAGRGQHGPDPWHTEGPEPHAPARPRGTGEAAPPGAADAFFKRLLVLVLRGGRLQNNDDGSKEISLQLKLAEDQWNVLEEYLTPDKVLTEEMYRRTVGYIADAVYKPTFSEKVVQAWGDYVLFNFYFYQKELTWTFTAVAVLACIVILSKYSTRKTWLMLILVILYLYEAFISLKEVEKQEFDKFTSAIKWCKWSFWSSHCDMPMPDAIVFLKHMHPGKIAIRIFALLITEPMVLISSSVGHGITDNLWPPFNTIFHAVLVSVVYIVWLVVLIPLIFYLVFNIPTNISFLGGLINLASHRQHVNVNNNHSIGHGVIENQRNADSLSGENLRSFFKIIYSASNTNKRQSRNVQREQSRQQQPMIRSYSAGRAIEKPIEVRFVKSKKTRNKFDGSGDTYS